MSQIILENCQQWLHIFLLLIIETVAGPLIFPDILPISRPLRKQFGPGTNINSGPLSNKDLVKSEIFEKVWKFFQRRIVAEIAWTATESIHRHSE